jgi:ubiquinone/menaquinone biosynthesis C-methylase UbiE
MPHKFDPQNMKKLEERKKILPPMEVLIELGLGPGDVFVDIGAGTGYFSLPALDIVEENGRVIAVDTSREMLDELESRVKSAGASNIEIIQSDEYDLKVADSSASFAFICTVLHEVEDKILFLTAIQKAMKTGGRLAIVEWIKQPMEKGPPPQDRIDISEAADMARQTGFRSIQSRAYNEFFYFVTALK